VAGAWIFVRGEGGRNPGRDFPPAWEYGIQRKKDPQDMWEDIEKKIAGYVGRHRKKIAGYAGI